MSAEQLEEETQATGGGAAAGAPVPDSGRDEPTISEPGVYPDLPMDDYVRDPVIGGSLSASGARKLVSDVPARFAYEREHPAPASFAMELGTAAHELVLGSGRGIAKIEADDWRKKDTREKGEDARANGLVPLLAKDYDVVVAMAAAIREHEIAGKLLGDKYGQREATAVWRDATTGVMCRARYDVLPPRPDSGRLILADYKSSHSADEDSFAKSAANYGYAQQAAFYCDGATALDLGPDPVMVFVVQETRPPYLVNVIGLTDAALRLARGLNRKALQTYRECEQAGVWPGYEGVNYIGLPSWFEYKHMDVA